MTMSNRPDEQIYDFKERTARFGETTIDFAVKLPRGPISSPLITQFIRAATSVGANYCEADDAESKKDFRHKIAICRKGARETKHWLRMIARAIPESKDQARHLWQEVKELHLILSKILRNTELQ